MLMNTNAEILKTASTFSHSLTTAQLIDACEWVAAHPGTEEEALAALANCRHDSAQEEALIRQIALAGVETGDVLLLGRFGGAYCNRYRVLEKVDGYMILAPVVAVSVKNDDGTFSTVWECARG